MSRYQKHMRCAKVIVTSSGALSYQGMRHLNLMYSPPALACANPTSFLPDSQIQTVLPALLHAVHAGFIVARRILFRSIGI